MPAQEKSENSSSHNNPTDEPDNDTLDGSTNSQESPASVLPDTPSPRLRRSSQVAAADARARVLAQVLEDKENA